MAAASNAPTPDDDGPKAEARPASTLRIVEDWKGMPALLDGDRLVTRSASIENIERMKDDLEAKGKRPFSTKVAPATEPDPD